MLPKACSIGIALLISLAEVLVSVGTSQAAPPDGGFRHGGHHHHRGKGSGRHDFHLHWRFLRFYGYYPYYPLDYSYALAREQQIRLALQQEEQLRAALLQLQWNAVERAQRERSRQARSPDPQPNLYAPESQQRAPSPAPAPLTPEARAAIKYKQAMLLAEEGKPADAVDYCREILTRYPDTPAALRAQEYLDRLTQR